MDEQNQTQETPAAEAPATPQGEVGQTAEAPAQTQEPVATE